MALLMHLNQEFDFPKYKGRGYILEEVIEMDPEYVKWLMDNNFLTLTDDAESYLSGVLDKK